MLEKNTKIIIIVLIIAIVLLLGVGTTLFFTTDLLKSNDALFKKYIAQNVKRIAEVVDIETERNSIDQLLKNNYTENTQMEVKYLKNENDQEEVYNIKEEGVSKKETKNSFRNIEVTYNNDVLSNIMLLREEDMFGFRMANLVKKYVNVKNASIAYLVSSLGYDGNYFQEKLNIDDIDVSELLDFSDEEIAKLVDNYSKIIFNEIDKTHYSTKKNSMITLNNGESITTKAHILTLNKNEIDIIYKKLLDYAKSDQIILSKLEKIDYQIKNIGINELEGTSLKERYIDYLQGKMNNIEYEGEDNREYIFTVYEEKGITYRTSIKTEENEIILDIDNKDLKTISLKTIKYTEEGSDEVVYEFKQQKNENGNDRIFKMNDGNQNVEITTKLEKEQEVLKLSANLDYKSNDIYSMNMNSKTEINIGKKDTITETFEKNEVIVINDYEDGDTIRAIFKQLKDIFIEELEKTQSRVNTKMLNSVLVWIDDKEKQAAEELLKNTELQKQRFNNQFILYKGEELDYKHVHKLLSTVQNNMIDYQVVNGKKIKILIKKGEHNEEKSNQIKNAINKDHKYNVEINYADDGYIDSIDISIYEKK